ncbi:type II toxin-antitoxin system Phd/YefM family antitoxin [Enterovibrio norvegicus]|uniref:type II toxin-antitoxin system Phd/YefM family antitoxin n=1 Tax=Enterovibrio norvegicus TaxID=188144 RepID=UPI003553D15B
MKIELVTSLERQATEILSELRESKEPVLLTEDCKPSAYLVDVEEYEFMQNRLAQLEDIAHGESSVAEGRVTKHAEAKDKMSKWLN